MDTEIKIKSNTNYNDQEIIGSMIIGLGSWRVRSIVRKKTHSIIARLEGVIRQCCSNDDLDVSQTKEYEYWDTKDPTGRKTETQPFSLAPPSPCEVNKQEHPRLQIENRVYRSRVFRKIHIGTAIKEDGQQVIHLFMYPRPQFY